MNNWGFATLPCFDTVASNGEKDMIYFVIGQTFDPSGVWAKSIYQLELIIIVFLPH
jgi:hypothetical protein